MSPSTAEAVLPLEAALPLDAALSLEPGRAGAPEVVVEAAGRRVRLQSRGEEIANTLSHALGVVLAARGLGVLLGAATQRGIPSWRWGVGIFGVALVLVYVSSTLYHALPRGRLKGVFQAIDYSAIYIMIAGTYSPFALGALRASWGPALFTVQWAVAAAGIALSVLNGKLDRRSLRGLAVVSYLVMGWMAAFLMRPMMQHVAPQGLLLLLAGGISFTAGVVFFSAHRVPYHHLIWHFFVMAGSACHFVSVLKYSF